MLGCIRMDINFYFTKCFFIMEDVIFNDVGESKPKYSNLKELLKEEGRTQTWLIKKLEEYGIKRDKAQVSQYCRNIFRPRDEYVIRAIAEIINVDFQIVNNCFSK